MKASAYLSIFDDWDILPTALVTIYDRVDEIVVVDGAYDWMVPFFRGGGRDPSVMLPELRDALSPFAPKLRFVSRLWRNEMEKRRAGYEACSHRFIYRVDADEVLFFDEVALERFFARPGSSGRGFVAVAGLSLFIVAFRSFPDAFLCFALCRRGHWNAGAARLAQADCNRLLRRANTMLPLADMLNLFVNEFSCGCLG